MTPQAPKAAAMKTPKVPPPKMFPNISGKAVKVKKP